MAAALANSSPGLFRGSSFLDDLDCRCSTSAPAAKFLGDRSYPRLVSPRSGSDRFRAAAIRQKPENALFLEKLPDSGSNFCLRPIVSTPEDRFTKNTLDRWVHEAVVEIVKNLRDAPFLHFIFDSNLTKSRSETCKISRESFANPDSWSYISKSALDHSPDGMILVQRLDDETSQSLRRAATSLPARCPLGDTDQLCPKSGSDAGAGGEICSKLMDGTTDVWGVLVQGRSLSRSSCYILQTTRVAVAGASCTRFCLTRAQCFGPSFQAQLESMWLVPAANSSSIL